MKNDVRCVKSCGIRPPNRVVAPKTQIEHGSIKLTGLSIEIGVEFHTVSKVAECTPKILYERIVQDLRQVIVHKRVGDRPQIDKSGPKDKSKIRQQQAYPWTNRGSSFLLGSRHGGHYGRFQYSDFRVWFSKKSFRKLTTLSSRESLVRN